MVNPAAGERIQHARPLVLVLSDKLGITPFLRVAASVSMSSLYNPDLQAATDGGKAFASQFSGAYQLGPGSIPAQGVSFEHRSPLGVYAWELWLHTRMRAWQRLAQAGHYDEALEELRYVWDPDGGGWRVLPLQKVAAGDSVRDVLEWLAAPAGHERDRGVQAAVPGLAAGPVPAPRGRPPAAIGLHVAHRARLRRHADRLRGPAPGARDAHRPREGGPSVRQGRAHPGPAAGVRPAAGRTRRC